MVKKKKAAKTVAKKAAKRAAKKAAKKPAAKGFNGAKNRAAKTAKPRRKSEEQMELIPGTRYADLDRLCKNIGDTRDDIAQLQGEDADLCRKALKAMRVHGVDHYKASGILLDIVPGDEKLRVKKDRSNRTADGGQKEEPAGGEETGEGQDPGKISEALTEGTGDEGSGDEE